MYFNYWVSEAKEHFQSIPDNVVLGVTDATGIWGMEALEKELKEALPAPPPLVMGEAEEVTGELFSTRLGEFSHALRADSICWGTKTSKGFTDASGCRKWTMYTLHSP